MASKNTPTAIVSGAYWAASFMEKLSSSLRSAGWSNEQIHSLVTQQGGAEMERGVAAFIKAVTGKVFNPHNFFVTRPGLRVWNEFENYILAAVGDEPIAPAALDKSYDLPEEMREDKLREKLGESHVFNDPTAFCQMLAKMIDEQWGGKKGKLLNSYANIFFVRGMGGEVFVVPVFWHSVNHEWFVSTSRVHADRCWHRGNRASPATVELGN